MLPPPHPVLFNFLNGTRMIIILNKQNRVEMRATRSEHIPLSFLNDNASDSGLQGQKG